MSVVFASPIDNRRHSGAAEGGGRKPPCGPATGDGPRARDDVAPRGDGASYLSHAEDALWPS